MNYLSCSTATSTRTANDKDGLRNVIRRDPHLTKVAKKIAYLLIDRYNSRTGFYSKKGKNFFPSNDYFQHWLDLGEKQVERGREELACSEWLIVGADGRLDLNWERAASILATIEKTWKERRKLVDRKRLTRNDVERFKATIDDAYAKWHRVRPTVKKSSGNPPAPIGDDETHQPGGELHDVAAKEPEPDLEIEDDDQGTLPNELQEGVPPAPSTYPNSELPKPPVVSQPVSVSLNQE
jgi:hypothetical protein